MAQLIDTSVFITLERRGRLPDDLRTLTSSERIYLAAITASELLVGVYQATTAGHREPHLAYVEGILRLMPVLPFDLVTARRYAEVLVRLKAAGTMIGAHDLMIAATALVHDCAVLTENERHFMKVPGPRLDRPNWGTRTP